VPSRLPVAASITYEPSMRKVVPALSRAPYERALPLFSTTIE
jgi:hypothetical protein